jgi:hypothetical protein
LARSGVALLQEQCQLHGLGTRSQQVSWCEQCRRGRSHCHRTQVT